MSVPSGVRAKNDESAECFGTYHTSAGREHMIVTCHCVTGAKRHFSKKETAKNDSCTISESQMNIKFPQSDHK